MFFQHVLTVSLCAVVWWQGWLAWKYCMLTPWEMDYYLGKKGIPFLCHEGMWGDFFLISPLVAVIFSHYCIFWSFGRILSAVILGTIVSCGMHISYQTIPWAEAHVQDGKLTVAGKILSVYMTIAIAVFILFYFATPNVDHRLLWIVSALLIVHTILGTHVVLGIVKPKWYPGDPLHSWGTWLPIAVVALGTFGRTWYIVTH